MGRKKSENPSKPLDLTLPPDAHACLVLLVKMGRYGGSAAEVARYMILREIDDLTRAGVLPKGSGV